MCVSPRDCRFPPKTESPPSLRVRPCPSVDCWTIGRLRGLYHLRYTHVRSRHIYIVRDGGCNPGRVDPLTGYLPVYLLGNDHLRRVSEGPYRVYLAARSAQAMKLFPIGFTFWKELDGGVRLQGQVYDYLHPYWRARYNDQNWEELSRRELERLAK
ncbi:unnamed protein product [Ectocarpus sp. 12 AP-2014]